MYLVFYREGNLACYETNKKWKTVSAPQTTKISSLLSRPITLLKVNPHHSSRVGKATTKWCKFKTEYQTLDRRVFNAAIPVFFFLLFNHSFTLKEGFKAHLSSLTFASYFMEGIEKQTNIAKNLTNPLRQYF